MAAAARVGAPLAHDFCVISLSDLLTPWELIAKRIDLAGQGDFAVAFYNAVSNKRSWQLLEARQVKLQEQAHWLNQNSFQALVGGPYYWYQLRREITDFQAEVEKAWQALGGVVELVQQLERIGLQVA